MPPWCSVCGEYVYSYGCRCRTSGEPGCYVISSELLADLAEELHRPCTDVPARKTVRNEVYDRHLPSQVP